MLRVALPALALGAVCCTPPESSSADASASAEDYPSYILADSIYVVSGAPVGELRWDDPEPVRGFLSSTARIPHGYVAADGRNREVVFLDQTLRVTARSGRSGDGPGEYQFPSALVATDTSVFVMDEALGRITQLSLSGELVGSIHAYGMVEDLAVHPSLGLLVTGRHYADHYLQRIAPEGNSPFGPIPATLHPGPEPPLFRARNLVAVTADGTVHVLDGTHLALVSFDTAGREIETTFLPHAYRSNTLDRVRRRLEARARLGELSVTSVTDMQALADGRLSMEVAGPDFRGFVLDLDLGKAIPLLPPAATLADPDPTRFSFIQFFDDSRVVFQGDLGGLVAMSVDLRPIPSLDPPDGAS